MSDVRSSSRTSSVGTTFCRRALVCAAVAGAAGAGAYPEGAPWGAANPLADESCSSCHFDGEAVQHSAAISLRGLPARARPGAAYELELEFDDPAIVSAGFQIISLAGGASGGRFSASADGLEAIGGAIRSTAVKARGAAAWSFAWHAPAEVKAPITLYVAATAGNDDGSPLGDTVHYRAFAVDDAAD